MNIYYIILAHKSPEQVFRLVKQLKEPWTQFYIHIDKNVDINPFLNIFKPVDNIFFLDGNLREEGTWGDIGIVKATLNALQQVAKNYKNGYCVLLSGQDYPIASNLTIKEFFYNKSGIEFITAYPIPNNILNEGGLPRINKYKINKSNKRGHFLFLPTIYEKEFYSLKTAGKLNFLRKGRNFRAMVNIFKLRRFPKYLEPFAGSQWWALSTNMVKEIINFIKVHPDYLHYNKFSLLPDEMFFQSILLHLQKIDHFQIERSKTYVNWEKTSGPLPVTFELTDFKELKKASKDHLFARKFDIDIDEKILNSIDKYLLKNSYEKD
jgi:hypothetical protein